MKLSIIFLFLFSVITGCAQKAVQTKKAEGFDATLNGFNYPFTVEHFDFSIQDEKVSMAYMDIPSVGDQKGTMILLHGKNFGGYYFVNLIKDLTKAGFRVIAPDQIGFGKSSKPDQIQYSFHLLAKNTFALLDQLNIKTFTLTGHSMGGMLATRMALLEPSRVTKLILVNPIGLEDYKLLTGYRSVDQNYAGELQNSPEKIKNYQLEYYYNGQWKSEYDALNIPAAGWIKGPDFARTAKVAALTSDMVYTQPVAYEFKYLKMPTILTNGDLDKTAIGKAYAPEANKKLMGNYKKLGADFKKTVRGSKLIELKGLGHVPFIQDYDLFWKSYSGLLK